MDSVFTVYILQTSIQRWFVATPDPRLQRDQNSKRLALNTEIFLSAELRSQRDKFGIFEILEISLYKCGYFFGLNDFELKTCNLAVLKTSYVIMCISTMESDYCFSKGSHARLLARTYSPAFGECPCGRIRRMPDVKEGKDYSALALSVEKWVRSHKLTWTINHAYECITKYSETLIEQKWLIRVLKLRTTLLK